MSSTSLPVEQGDQVHFVADIDWELRELEVAEISESEVSLEGRLYSVTLDKEEFLHAVEDAKGSRDEGGFPRVWLDR